MSAQGVAQSVPDAFVLSPSQATRLLALCAMLRDGDLSFRGENAEDEEAAGGILRDIGEEIALQIGDGSCVADD